MGDTLNFIDIWPKLFDHNYDVRCEIYNRAMKKMFQKNQQQNRNLLFKVKNSIN